MADPLTELRSSSHTREIAWRALYDAHFEEVRSLMFRGGVGAADVDDLAQRVFVIAHDGIDTLPYLTHPGAWLRGIALRVMASHRRWRHVRRVKAWIVREREEDRTGVLAPDQTLERSETARQVQDVLDRLRRHHREVLLLSDVEGLSLAEVSEALGVPVNTVRSRRHGARQEFARLWRQRQGRGEP